MPDVVRVNDKTFSYQSTRTKIDGELFEGISAMSFDEKLETAYVYGQRRSGAPIAQTSGKYTPPELKVTFLEESANALIATLSARSLDASYGGVPFVLAFQGFEVGLPPFLLVAGSCRITGHSGSYQDGADGLKKDLIIKPLTFAINGVTLYRKI